MAVKFARLRYFNVDNGERDTSFGRRRRTAIFLDAIGPTTDNGLREGRIGPLLTAIPDIHFTLYSIGE